MAKKKPKKKKDLEKQAEEFLNRELPKAQHTAEEKLDDLEKYIKKEPLKSVTAAFMLGIFVGRLMR